ncbi:DASS family sodium-coupled anion symporter [Brenneria populi subsp. brevivirga]|uniref:SLC13 family permease n=1 Tax=Brenneria populi TaxID=1505588 RepID=UPI002E173251|nr:DASS family sodium-coupled anion symporter [Brenneria populi subsp. brevivirga]
MAEKKAKTPAQRFMFFGLAAAIVLLICLLPTPEGLTADGQRALALFVGIIFLWATEPVPLAIVSLIMVPVVVGMEMMTVSKTLNNFSTSSIFLIVGALLMAPAMSKSGFAERLIYWLLSKVGCTSVRITFGITLANIALAFIIPSTAARTAALLPICISLIEIFKQNSGLPKEGRSNFAVGLLLTLAFTNSIISAGILTATIPNPVTVDFIYKATGRTISYAEWFIYGFPPALIMTFFAWWLIKTVFKAETNEIPGGKEVVAEKLKAMGKMSTAEWKSCLVFLFVVLLWMTGSITHINTTVAAIIGVCLMFLVGVINWNDAAKTSAFQFMLIMGGGFIVADLLISTGAAKWVATSLFGLLNFSGSISILLLLLIVIFIVQYMHIPFMGTTKMTTMLIPIVISIAEAAHIDPMILAMPAGMIIGGFPLFLFFNTISSLLVYGTDELRMSDFPKVGIPICTVAVVVYSLMAVTYWRWLGLF